MKILKIFALGVIFSTIAFVFPSNLSNAKNANSETFGARCAIPTFAAAKNQARAIFVGKVLNKKSNGDEKIFEFEIKKYWKGDNKKKIKVSVYENPRFQAWFETGETYLVFADADGDEGKLFVGRCSRSKEIDAASEDLKLLGSAKKPKN
jgi:hypothetical protein